MEGKPWHARSAIRDIFFRGSPTADHIHLLDKEKTSFDSLRGGRERDRERDWYIARENGYVVD